MTRITVQFQADYFDDSIKAGQYVDEIDVYNIHFLFES